MNESAPGPEAARGGSDADRAYLSRVRAEIDDEVRRRRASGDLPPQLEAELEQLFLKHAPLGSTRQELHEVLRMVDAAAFIDPVVPVESSRAGGAVVKKSIRSMNFWYLRFITHQVSQFATAVSRSLHILDQQMSELARKVDAVEVPPSVVVDAGPAHRADAWWVPTVLGELEGCRRRVLHAACGDGWLVAVLVGRDIDGYGVDPRPGRVAGQELGDLDLREEPVLPHLQAVEPGALGSGDPVGAHGGIGPHRTPSPAGERHHRAGRRWRPRHPLPDGGQLGGGRRAAEADIVQARPYRPATWLHLLGELGLVASVASAPDGADYLVVARRHPDPPAPG